MAGVCVVNGRSDRQWVKSLRQAVTSLGKSFVLVDQLHPQDDLQKCELVIIDAGAIIDNDLSSVVRGVRSYNSRVRIVVVSSAPHWKEARRTLLAGATDYVRKVDSREAILDILRDNVPTLLRRSK